LKIKSNFWSIAWFILITLFLQTETKPQQTDRIFSLDKCIGYAAVNSPNIKSASIQEEISTKKINEAIGSGLPQMNISGSLVNNLELPAQLIPAEFLGGLPGQFVALKFGTKYNYTFTGQITQKLFDASFWLGLDAAKYSNQYYKQNSENIVEGIYYNVATAYYQTLVVQKQIQLLEQNLKSVEKSLADTKLLLENGKAKEVDVDRLNVSFNIIMYQLKNTKENLNQSYNNLKYQMGMPIQNGITLSDSVNFTDDSLLEKKITDLSYTKEQSTISYDNRSDYRMLQTSLELQNLDRKNQIAQYLPTISAFGSYTIQGQRANFDLFDSGKDWYKYYSVGLQFNVPIFTGGQTLAKVQQSSLNIDKLSEQIRQTKEGINLQISNAISKYNSTYDNIKTDKQNIDLAQKVYDITLIEYQEGESTAMTLVDSETKLREAQTNYINSLLELYIARLDLEKANGTLTTYLTKTDKQ
jgi:outer membrane protein TolC